MYKRQGRASIKAEAKVSSPELAYYDKGMSVNYDKVLTADGHQWLSYMTSSGARRYVDIATVKATETKPEVKPVAKPADQPSLPESGTYTFTGRVSIKAEAKVSSPEDVYKRQHLNLVIELLVFPVFWLIIKTLKVDFKALNYGFRKSFSKYFLLLIDISMLSYALLLQYITFFVQQIPGGRAISL